ncbi:sugar transferase [Aquaticitalea lipolytica]|jgi:lipopolysaccharide/colanic/teichoic acid biosynthesis glycosyltransferase|uniref:Sugar transferase n=1 Tax=Aquaticitalea lipolytica TaxID=1247562 RepID=A0A8J2XGU5_9FLAO|nr:sugar transferase [Aquaticitalea lipolytica]GFZ85313.1 sugar transferase [Aquaticitalea lipolytica]
MAPYKNILKPIFDFVIAIISLIISSPIFITLIIILVIVNNGKPFFFQKRAGKNGKTFSIIKIKTMNDKKDIHGKLLPFNERVTKIGAFIRKYSLDEIPQLINIIKGDMSLIGPRPLHPEYLPLYNKVQARRHEVMPGITGWAQVNGRNTISWEQKFNHDVWYVDNQSFVLDIKILFLTFYKVIKKKDINNSVSANMPAFKGADVE